MSRARTRLERVPAPIWVAAAVALAVLAGVAALLLGMRGHATVYFRGDYESGGLSQWRGPQLTAGARADVEAPTVRQGRYAAVFTTRASKTRARSQVFVGQAETDGYEGQEVWYAWSTMVARGSVLAADTAWNNLTAWHQTGTRCPAPDHFRIDTSSGVWRLELDAWGGPLDERRCSNPYRRTWHLGRLRPGRWYDFVFHVEWSHDPDVGFVELWLNGRHVLPLTHAATLYTGQGVYWKQGFDTGGARGATTVYNDASVAASSRSAATGGLDSAGEPAAGGGSQG